jgi:hypothetical protein
MSWGFTRHRNERHGLAGSLYGGVRDMRILVTFITIIIHNGGVGVEFLQNKETERNLSFTCMLSWNWTRRHYFFVPHFTRYWRNAMHHMLCGCLILLLVEHAHNMVNTMWRHLLRICLILLLTEHTYKISNSKQRPQPLLSEPRKITAAPTGLKVQLHLPKLTIQYCFKF